MPDMPANQQSSSSSSLAGGAGLRELIAKWREPLGKPWDARYNVGWQQAERATLNSCANELEAVLSALPDVGEVRRVDENADGLREGSTVPGAEQRGRAMTKGRRSEPWIADPSRHPRRAVCLRVAARFLNIGERALRARIEAGDIEAHVEGRVYRISVSALVDYRARCEATECSTGNAHISSI